MTSPYRIAALTEDPFTLPDDLPLAPTRTESGAPWVRWANVGNHEGWYAYGSRKPPFAVRPTFWQKTFTLCSAIGNVHMDAVHTIGPGILSLGALGVTASSGYAQALLHYCLESNPARFLQTMMPAMHASKGLYPRDWRDSPSGYVFSTVEGVVSSAEVRELIQAPYSKLISHLWVEGCSHLLRDDSFDEVQVAFLQDFAPKLLSQSLRTLLRWPRTDVPDTWSFTAEQQALWAVAISLVLEDEVAAEQVITAARQEANDAEEWMRKMRVAASSGVHERFEQRLIAAERVAQELFNVNLGVAEA
jgi:hypothetical protein